MAEQTGISWTDSTVCFWQGCTKVSPACDHCYAERRNKWLHGGENWGPGAPRLHHSTAAATVRSWQRNAAKFRAQHDRDRRVFVNSTSDWLDNEVPIEWLVDLLDAIRLAPDVTFLLLSKRIGNWRKRISEAESFDNDLTRWLKDWLEGNPPANVWLGATVIDQTEADRDVPKLLSVPARVRFVSIEPMLGPVDVTPMFEHRAEQHGDTGVHWIIAGSESGPHARRDPAMLDWVRSLRDQCAAAGVAFHWKQDAERGKPIHLPELDGKQWAEFPT